MAIHATLAARNFFLAYFYPSGLFICIFPKPLPFSPVQAPQWGAADAEIKVPSGENTELGRSPFKAWGGSVYSHTCLLPGFSSLLISTLPVHSSAFFSKTTPDFFLRWPWLKPVPVWACGRKQVALLDAGSRVECPRNVNRLKKNMTSGMMTCETNNLEIE